MQNLYIKKRSKLLYKNGLIVTTETYSFQSYTVVSVRVIIVNWACMTKF